MSDRHRVQFARRSTVRAALLLSSAIGVAGAGIGHAQTVVIDQTADIIYNNPGTVSGTPQAIDLNTDGAITATIGTVNGTSVSGNSPDGENSDLIRMETEGANAINATIGTITSTGTGDVYAFNAQTDAGDANITVGTIDLAGNSTVGVLVESNTGNIRLNGTSVYTRGLTFNEKGVTGDGLTAITGGTVAINSGFAQSDSLYGSAIVAIGGAGVTVTSANAKTTGQQGVALSATSAGGDVRVKSGTIQTSADQAAGLSAVANAGQVYIDSGTISAGGATATGIGATGYGGVTIQAGTTNTGGRAIGAGSANGDVSVTTTGDTIARTTGAAIGVNGGNIAVSTAAGTTTSSFNNNAIGFTARNNVTITNAGTAIAAAPVTVGGTIAGIAGGAVNITSQITTNTGNGSAILATGGNGVTIDATTVTASALQNAIQAIATTAGDTSVKVGTLTGSAGSNSINATSQNGSASVTAGSVTNGNTAGNSSGIFASGRTGIAINAGSVRSTGIALRGTSSGGDVTIATTGDTTSASNNAIRGDGGNVSITTAAGTTTSGSGSTILANARGNATVTNNGTVINTSGPAGISVFAGGAAKVSSNIVNVTTAASPAAGTAAAGIYVATTAGGTIDITSQAVTVDGPARDGIHASSTGFINIISGSASTTASDRAAISVSGGSGTVTVKSGTATASGDGSPGILVQTTSGNIDIASTAASALGLGYVNFTSDAIVGISDTGMVKIVSGATRSDGQFGSAITAQGGGGVNVTSTSAVINGEGGVGIGVSSSGGNAALNSGSLIFNGTTGGGISVVSTVGNANAVIDTVDARGGSNISGVGVSGALGATVKAGTIASSGVGLFASAATGNVVINSGSVTTTGAGADAVRGKTTSGSVTINSTGSISTAGAGRTVGGKTQYADGILGVSESGAITINNAADITTTGQFGSAIKAESGTGITSFATSTPLGAGSIVIGNTGTLRTSGGSAVFVQPGNSDTSVTNAGSIITMGASGSAISIQAGNGARTVVNSGTITTSGTTGAGATILVGTGAVSATNTGTITTAAAGADGFRFFLTNGTTAAGIVSVINTGTIAATTAAGLNLAASAPFAVTNTATGNITGGQAGILQTAGTVSIVNAGTIAGTSAAAISTTGATSLVNSGAINGVGATAVILGGADDTVELRTGSSINGIVDFGAGNDALLLNGSGTTASIPTQTIAATANLEAMNVASGYWTAKTGTSTVGSVNIATGATLEIVGGTTTVASAGAVPADGGQQSLDMTVARFSSPLQTTSIADNGALVLNYSTGLPARIDTASISGTGSVRFVGSDAVTVSSPNLSYTGATSVSNGTVVLTGNLVGDVVTSGGGTFRLGDGGTNGTVQGNLINNGAFVYDRADSYTLAGNFTGTGAFTKLGTGKLTIDGNYGFTGTTTIAGGSVAFSGALAPTTELDLKQGMLDLSNIDGGMQTVSELAGSSQGSIALGDSNLTVNQATSTAFDGTIAGTGGLTKAGTGTLNLTGTNTYSGDTNVSGGTLKVNGALPNSTVRVTSGGTLGGNGIVGGLTSNGGVLAPGNSIGRISVNGNINLNSTSIYQVEANAAGQADRVDATGTAALGGAKVQVLAASGIYRPATNYTILTAAGGVSGTFSGATSNLAFLTPSLSYSPTAVTLTLTRNNIAFAAAGTNANERGVGGAIQGLGAGNALFESTLTLTDSGVAPAFASLTGESQAALASGLIEDTQPVRTTLLGLAGGHQAGLYGWASGIGTFQRFGGRDGAGRLNNDTLGGLGGIGFAANNFEIGIGGGQTTANYRSSVGGSSADVDTSLVVGYGAGTFAGLTAKIGGSYGWNSIDSRRFAAVGTLANTLTGSFDARTWQAFAELGYDIPVGSATITPFAGYAYVDTESDGFAESGGSAALRFAKGKRNASFATLGLRLASETVTAGGISIKPYASGAFRHASGDRLGIATAGFIGGTDNFTLTGASIVKDAADIGGGVELSSGRFGLRAAYTGVVARDYADHGAKVTVSVRF